MVVVENNHIWREEILTDKKKTFFLPKFLLFIKHVFTECILIDYFRVFKQRGHSGREEFF